MARFDLARKRLASFEGEYVNMAADRGGETYAGISRRFYPRWKGWVRVDALKQAGQLGALKDDPEIRRTVDLFYLTEYWEPLRCHRISDQALAEELFEQAVNLGMRRAARHLQRAINATNRNVSVAVDGVMGMQTVLALGSIDAAHKTAVLKAMNILQGYHYLTLCEEDPTQEVFALGWLART